MNIIFFSHPDFLGFQSIPRFTNMLAKGMKKRGHTIDIWSPKPKFYKFAKKGPLKKWLGYIDQYFVFPAQIRKRVTQCPEDTLFVFTDHALGPWIPYLSNRLHVVHCHDFLAQHSAMGKISENLTSWTGRKYQQFIRAGFSKGKNFISVSEKSRADLHQLLPVLPELSDVVYNGLNQAFIPIDHFEAQSRVSEQLGIAVQGGYLLHVGGNHWYKNRKGVIEIYNQVRENGFDLPLLMIGEPADEALLKLFDESPFKDKIHLLSGVEDSTVRLAYCGASLLLFPSLAEGFGWPIAEAMASGCPVVTTNEAPMTEVAGDAGFLIPRMPFEQQEIKEWAKSAAEIVGSVLKLSPGERASAVEAGLQNARRFDTEDSLDRIEAIYLKICSLEAVTTNMALTSS